MHLNFKECLGKQKSQKKIMQINKCSSYAFLFNLNPMRLAKAILHFLFKTIHSSRCQFVLNTFIVFFSVTKRFMFYRKKSLFKTN